MGFLSPDVQQQDNFNIATPLASSVLDRLRKQVTSGEFGMGLGPLQREAGTALRQFMDAGNRFAFGTGAEPGTGTSSREALASSLEGVQDRRVNEQAADLREGFGEAGTRFGSTLATGEGRFRRDTETDFMATLASIFEQGRQFDVGAGLEAEKLKLGEFENAMMRELQGIFGLQEMGNQNILPLLQLAMTGILPPDNIVTESPFVTGGNLLGQLLMAGGAAKQAGLFGGGSGPTRPGGELRQPR